MSVLPKPIPAKRYFRGSGILMVVAGMIVALVGIAATDTFGRVFAGLMAALLGGAGMYRLRKSKAVSEHAVVRETLDGRRVGYVLDERE